LDIRDWVLLRESIDGQISFQSWKELRAKQDTTVDASIWLNKTSWNELGSKYASYVLLDIDKKKNKEMAVYDFTLDDWLYFRGGITETEDTDQSIQEALITQKNKIQSAGLSKYVDVFSKIGMILIIFSIIIALFSKPLQKLMHGVN